MTSDVSPPVTEGRAVDIAGPLSGSRVAVPELLTVPRDLRYRDFMSSFPSGVAVVTTIDPDGRALGFTCSSLCSVTLAPPTLLICANNRSGTLAALLARGVFAVNLLHDRGSRAATVFASGAANRLDNVAWEPSPRWELPHLVADAHSVAECRMVDARTVGTHTVVFGEVDEVTCHEGAPLLYGFRRLVSSGPVW
jgi:flavin reductase (DIM6/NTAB) family NADH-FMN oxidoreductase RutF